MSDVNQAQTKAQRKADKKAQRASESRGKKWSRRGFITTSVVGGGALLIGVGIRPGDRTDKLAKLVTRADESLLTTWVKLAPDNTVTAIIPHGEMGQGVHTALSAMLAEEMEADWDTMEIMEAPAEKAYANHILAREFLVDSGNIPGILMETVNGAFLGITKAINLQITGGSTSVRFTGAMAMQCAGAAAKELLLKAAAKTWDVSVDSLRAQKSYIYHDASGKSAPFAGFAQMAASFTPNLNPKLKARKDYTLMGTSLPRVDIPSKVDGTAMFGMDAQIDGMKYATIKAAPVHGQSIETFDPREAKKMPGVQGVYNMGDYIAVVADGYWQAKQAIEAVEVNFTSSEAGALDQAGVFAQYSKAIDNSKRKTIHKSGDSAATLSKAADVISTEYTVPFLAHACMEPMNATAWVRGGKCDLWTGTQNPLGTRAEAAKAAGLKLGDVTLHTAYMGGGFGRRSITDYAVQAVMVSKEADVPVKLIWSREETTQQDHYRPAVTNRLSAVLGDDGMPTTWNSIFVHKLDPKEASVTPYNIPNQMIEYVESPMHIRFGPWRSVDHTQHGFFIESFIDELAHKAGQDPYEYRRKLLAGKPRFLAVLDAAAKAGNWGAPLPKGQARGISIVESFMTIAAQVVTVDVSGDIPRAVHVACAADAGMAVNPDGFKAQMESGIIYGLTAALYGEISLEDGAVTQSNFHDYEMVRMDNAPEIDVVILQSDARLGGAGEPGTPPIAPAFANAVFAATGKRVRNLPIGDLSVYKSGAVGN
ncbi:MAG: molybdopterin cofactor-binding domain-containing protein [Litorimonas sp.]